MPVQFESVSLFDGGAVSATTVIVPAPAGIAEFDLLVALIVNNGFVSPSWTQPAGWIELEDRSRVPNVDTPSLTYAVKIATASEPPSYTWTNSASRPGRKGIIMRFSGAAGVDVHGNVNGALAGSVLCPDVITTVADALILRFGVAIGTGVTGSLSAPAGHTERAEVLGAVSKPGIAVYTEDIIQAIAGATGTESIVKTGFTGTQKDIGITVAIAPIAAPPDLSVPKIESVSSFTDSVLPLLPIPKPAGLAVGELMLGIVSNRIAGSAVTTVPAGWTKVTQVTPPFGVPDTTLAFKIADAADVIATDFIFTHSVAGGFAFVGAILRISGINPAAPINVFLFNDTFPGSSIATPDVVTTVNGCLLIRVDVSQSNSSGAHTASTPVGHTERVEISVAAQPGTGSHRLGMSVQTKDVNQPLAGSTGTELITVAGLGTNPSLVGLTIAIAPALPPVFQSAGQANDTGGGSGVGSLNVPHPSGLLVGDLMLAFMHLRQNPDRIYNTPSGWTNEGSSHDAGSNGRITIFSKTADSADVAAGSTTFICSQSDCFRLIGIILRLTEHNPLAPVDVVGFTIQAVASGSPASWVCPSVVTTVINAKILRADVITQDVVSGITAALASAIQRKVRQNATNSEIRIFEENAVQVAPGATGTATILITGGAGTHKGHGVTVALAPVITVPPGAGPAGGFKGPFRLLGRRWRVLGTGA